MKAIRHTRLALLAGVLLAGLGFGMAADSAQAAPRHYGRGYYRAPAYRHYGHYGPRYYGFRHHRPYYGPRYYSYGYVRPYYYDPYLYGYTYYNTPGYGFYYDYDDDDDD